MNSEPLPPDLHDLERLLARRPGPAPAAGLRDRLLAAAAEPPPAPGRRARFCGRAWPAAAAVVLALNLAMGAANGARYQSLRARVAGPADVAHGGSRLPPTPPTETDDLFGTLAASALAQLTPAPDAGPVCRRFLEHREN